MGNPWAEGRHQRDRGRKTPKVDLRPQCRYVHIRICTCVHAHTTHEHHLKIKEEGGGGGSHGSGKSGSTLGMRLSVLLQYDDTAQSLAPATAP